MTFQELNEKLGGGEIESDWANHSNGRGWVKKTASVDDSAFVDKSAWVSGNAHVYGDAWGKSPIYIQGSRYCVFQPKHGHIQIGCQCHPFAWWSTDAALEMAKNHGFTEAEIAEYREIVALIVKIGV